MNQGNFNTNRNYNNSNMGFNNNMGGGFNGPMGGNFGFNNRGNMMGGGMRGGPGGMRGNRGGGNMMGMNPMGGMPMGMPGNMGMMGMGGGMPGMCTMFLANTLCISSHALTRSRLPRHGSQLWRWLRFRPESRRWWRRLG